MLITIVCPNDALARTSSTISNIENSCKTDYNKKMDFYPIISFVNFILNTI